MKLFSKILIIFIIIFAYSVDSYSVVLRKNRTGEKTEGKERTIRDFYDNKGDDNDNKNNNKRNFKDYNPDRSRSEKKVKLSKSYKPKMIIFNFENFTKNSKNNYLVKLAAPSLTKKLKDYDKFNIEYIDIYFASVKIDDYSKYLDLLKNTSSRYNADYIITGFVHKPFNGVRMESLIYVARSHSILKVNSSGKNLGIEYNNLIDELAKKILGLLTNENIKLEKEGKHRDGSGKQYQASYQLGDYKFKGIGMTGYFSLFYARGLSTSIGYMATGMLYWELGSLDKLRNMKGVRDLALFWTIDVGRLYVNFDVLNQNSGVRSPMYHHFWGGVMGLKYNLKFKNIFSFDIGVGYGPMYSVTILLSNYTGVKSFLKPTSTLSTSIDHFFTMRFYFNIIVNPHVLFSFGASYHLISLEPQLFNGLAASAGIGFRF